MKGREDDNVETIRKRFKIDAAQSIEEVFEAVKAVFTPTNEQEKEINIAVEQNEYYPDGINA
ncbi:hypothetical protein CK203_041126 [Vitis vinifera]|uniref:Uncharacterized protein n=1 Tax=Vitis vinifera TaxID=29760 RepID=A0A438HT69_VITVI|nr:hypothetical protein CK203_041126 [Vitis vinifera]